MKLYTYIIISYNSITERDEVIYSSTDYQDALKQFELQPSYPNISMISLKRWFWGFERTILKVK